MRVELESDGEGEEGYVSAEDGYSGRNQNQEQDEDEEGYEEYGDGSESDRSIPPSPQYGIRDLPVRNAVRVGNGSWTSSSSSTSNEYHDPPHGKGRKPPLPARQPRPHNPPSNQIRSVHTHPTRGSNGSGGDRIGNTFDGLTKGQSVTLRMAAVSLSNGNGNSRAGNESAGTGPPPGWQTRVPAGDAGGSNTTKTKTRGVTTTTATAKTPTKTPRGRQPRERDWEMVDLDDLPPSSLRKPPVKQATRVAVPHYPHPPQPQTPPALPPRRWTSPSPTTPTTTTAATSPTKTRPAMRNPVPIPNHPRNKNQNPTRSRPVSAHVESPKPIGGRDSRPNIPRITFPDNGEGDDDTDDGEEGGPSIMVSGPDDGPPQISISMSGPDEDSEGGGRSRGPPQPQSHNSSRHPHSQSQQQQALQRTPIKRRAGGLVCGGCDGAIIGRIVSAMGVRWHPGCFRCTVCNELLEHVSSYEHEGWPYCHLDYHEVSLFILSFVSLMFTHGFWGG